LAWREYFSLELFVTDGFRVEAVVLVEAIEFVVDINWGIHNFFDGEYEIAGLVLVNLAFVIISK
jgi:hypothetical protein